MLKVFRDNLKYLSWVLWLVIAVFVLFAFFDFGDVNMLSGARGGSAVAATVGGMEVSYRDFEGRYRRVEDQYRQAYGDQFSRELANQIGLPLQVLNGLIDQRILLSEADRMGLAVTDEELQRNIVAMPELQKDGAFMGQAAYTELLRRNGLTPADFEASQREALLTEKLQSSLVLTAFVAPQEVEAAYREEAETATVRLLKLPASRFAAEVAVDEDALEAFFAEKRESFKLPERRVVDYLLVDPDAFRDAVALTADEVRAYYEEHAADYTSEEQVKARHILLRTGPERTVAQASAELEAVKARVEAGEDFAALAAELSDDPGSKARGGDLGFFARGAMVKPFEDAAFGAELGDLVGPVESSFGVHLIQVQARRPGGLQPLAEVEDGIRALLTSRRTAADAAAKAAELADRLRGSSPDGAALAALADGESAVTRTTTEAFGRDDNVPGIGRATEFTSRAFELEPGAVSEALQVARGWAVLALREIQPPRLPELDEVRAEVTAAYRAARQLEIARERMAAAHATLGAGKTFAEVADELGATPEDAGPFGAGGSVGTLGRAADVARLALTLDEGAISEPLTHDDEVVMFEVTARTRFDRAAYLEQEDSVRERLESERFAELLRSLLARRREELGVTYDPRVFETFGQTPESVS
ncbi:MAG: SurA N-terminal domain-containing protein [Acidobacteriota bacterium]|nr:SurA N-terminal domain-containing protein [Acidobacteriota bacterium]MDH3522294.1 SurA N-terminal domain-containing protein [Acidobacteriota bacterium]